MGLERVISDQDAQIYVDYAHTPHALKTILQHLKSICMGRLHVIFGCGGERDINKRYLMGEVANKIADSIVVTDDNPREENAHSIRKQILASCPKAQEISGRGNAIKYVINNIKRNDILLITGKGHEKYQLIGKNK